jgi:hypothetical protein
MLENLKNTPTFCQIILSKNLDCLKVLVLEHEIFCFALYIVLVYCIVLFLIDYDTKSNFNLASIRGTVL